MEKYSPQISRIDENGAILIAVTVIGVLTAIFTLWTQYNWDYFGAPLIWETTGVHYTPPGLYTYFVPFFLTFLFISFIPLIAYTIRKTEKPRLFTALGLLMTVAGFAASYSFQIYFGVAAICYTFYGCAVIWIGERIRKKGQESGQSAG